MDYSYISADVRIDQRVSDPVSVSIADAVQVARRFQPLAAGLLFVDPDGTTRGKKVALDW